MKIIIAGDGDTGVHLARQLSRDSQDVILIGSDRKRLDEVDAQYNIMTFEGNPTSPGVLRKAGTDSCDLFVSVTPWGNDNLVAASIAKAMRAGATVARLDCEEYLAPGIQKVLQSRGVDTVVYPEYLAAMEIKDTLANPWLRHRYELHEGRVDVLSVRLPASSPLVGSRLMDFNKTLLQTHVAAIKRNEEIIIPRGSDILKADDIVYFTRIPDQGNEHNLIELCGVPNPDIRKVMIAGGGKMTLALLPMLAQRYEVTVVEPDGRKCSRIADTCRGVTVVHGDFRNLDVLREEGISDTDAFIALSDYAETNIVSCMVARDMGVSKTIAEIEDLQYLAEADSLNIGSVINKKLLTSSTIYHMLLQSYLPTQRCLALEDHMEVVEIVAQEGSSITRRPVAGLSLKRGMTIGALVRDGRGMLVGGDTLIRPGDHVVVFCLGSTLHHIEHIFS